MLTSVLPVVASSAAIPDQLVTLTFNPIWTIALFAVSLVLACGAMWLLKDLERQSRNATRGRTSVTVAFPRPARQALAGHRA
jgi:hypothetical protein